MIKPTSLREPLDTVVIRFAGDSGDGMQTVGEQFTDSSALSGNDISTMPDFPAEIRAPQGTLPGVSGFQLQFGNRRVFTPGDSLDALVAMNPAGLKVNIADLDEKGILLVNTAAFSKENLRKAGYESNPLEDASLLNRYRVLQLDIGSMTQDALKDNPLKASEKARCKNFFALGFIYWLYDRKLDYTLNWIETKWDNKTNIIDANSKTLKAGYYFGETSELSASMYKVNPAQISKGVYRKISGNEALVIGLIAATQRANKTLVYGSYPITPASGILEGLAQYKHYGVKTMQAEDEIAAIGFAIGASFAGELGVTATAGPGFCLKSEALGLAIITELPLIVIDVQRGGPSTGLPTKTEQADLLQVMYGRNGESPVPVIAAATPSDCFDVAIEAVRIALLYRTPVVIMSELYLAFGSEPWKIPSVQDIPELAIEEARPGSDYIPYKRNPVTMARQLAVPGTPELEHRIGGLEKNEMGNVSYDPENHQMMCEKRAKKVEHIALSYAPTEVHGKNKGKVLVVGWGGTYGAITAAVAQCVQEGKQVGAVHLRHINPLPLDLKSIFKNFEKILIPELNFGQLALLIRASLLVNTESLCKVQGKPFTVTEIVTKINELL